jgi:hypothetical protein
VKRSFEAGVDKSVYEARSAESLGLPEVSINATQMYGVKTGASGNTARHDRLRREFSRAALVDQLDLGRSTRAAEITAHPARTCRGH